jgi:predicted nucleic acid-binding protein
MAVYFVDSSALVKRYINEQGSSWLDTLLGQSSSEVLIAEITQVEVIAALTRRGRSTGMSTQTASQIINRFKTHVSSNYQIISLSKVVISNAIVQAETHALRGYDAVQLATALEVEAVAKVSGLPTLTFISADNELNKVAQAAGLVVDNPNNHP